MSPHSDTLSFVPSQLVFALSPSYCVLSGEATNTNFLFFGLTRPGLEPMIYCTRGEHANHYTIDAVQIKSNAELCKNKNNSAKPT
jgi:hypothetical protein